MRNDKFWVMARSLKAKDFLMYSCLDKLCDNEVGYCFAGNDNIGEKLGVAAVTVSRNINALVKQGAVYSLEIKRGTSVVERRVFTDYDSYLKYLDHGLRYVRTSYESKEGVTYFYNELLIKGEDGKPIDVADIKNDNGDSADIKNDNGTGIKNDNGTVIKNDKVTVSNNNLSKIKDTYNGDGDKEGLEGVLTAKDLLRVADFTSRDFDEAFKHDVSILNTIEREAAKDRKRLIGILSESRKISPIVDGKPNWKRVKGWIVKKLNEKTEKPDGEAVESTVSKKENLPKENVDKTPGKPSELELAIGTATRKAISLKKFDLVEKLCNFTTVEEVEKFIQENFIE